MKSTTREPTYVTAETMYLPDSCRMGTGRASITACLREAVVAATFVPATPGQCEAHWLATPQNVGITGGDYATSDEALDACRAILVAEGFVADRGEAQRLAEAQAHARRHQFDGLPTDLAGTIRRLREQGVLAADQTLPEQWWRRGVNRNRARRAMLGDNHCIGVVRRDARDAR